MIQFWQPATPRRAIDVDDFVSQVSHARWRPSRAEAVEVSIRIWIVFGHGQSPHYNFPFVRHTCRKKGLRMFDRSETLKRRGALHVTSARA
jgi:hypothetical protein